jgi:hypothetical protein
MIDPIQKAVPFFDGAINHGTGKVQAAAHLSSGELLIDQLDQGGDYA